MDDMKNADSTAQYSLEKIKQYHTLRIGEEQVLLNILASMHHKNALEQTKTEEQIRIEALDAMEKYHKAHLSTMSSNEKQEYLATVKSKREQDIAAKKDELQRTIAHYTMLASFDKSYKDKVTEAEKALEDQEKIWAEEKKKLNASIYDAKMEALREEEAAKKASIDRQADYEKAKRKATGISGAIEQGRQGNLLDPKSGVFATLLNGASKMNLANMQAGLQSKATQAREKADASAQRVAELNEVLDKAKAEDADPETLAKIIAEGQAAQLEATKDANKAAAAEMASAVADAVAGDYKKAVNEAETILNDYMGAIDARMQGSDKNFKDMSNKISSNLSVSPFVKTTKVLEKLKEATDKGISYNTEQRAFLSSLTDKIATTFDAFDSNLLRIIRLQQADSTASRMGMEASLTKLFNNMFQDTSYLSDVADSISGAIVDASSQLNHEASAEFEYVVQKWLGALSSLGMSSDSLTQIATGINYLATGNVTSLASNESLQTMFAMAASNANLEYSEILLNGLDANTTNKLLESMVVYLKDIADNSENQVVKAAYGDIFKMSLSDMRALSNLTTTEISSLSGNMMSYNQMQNELNNQFGQLSNRTSIATMLTNVYDNVLYSVASDMVNNPVFYSMQKMLDFMDEKKIDFSIPFVNAAGFGLDLNTSVADLMRTGLGGAQALSLAGNIVNGLSSGGGLNLDGWGATTTTQRGSGLNLSTLSTLGGTSSSIGTFAMNSNSADIKNSSISSATDDAEETKKITNKNQKTPEKTLDDLFKAIVGESAESYVVTHDETLRNVYDPAFKLLRVRLEGLNLLNGTIPVFDAAVKDEITLQMKAINTLLNKHHTEGIQKVELVEGTILKIEQETIAAAIRQVLFDNEEKTLNELLNTIENGTLKVDSIAQPVNVRNATGEKLQVSNLVW